MNHTALIKEDGVGCALSERHVGPTAIRVRLSADGPETTRPAGVIIGSVFILYG
jgi:hypothetical protein